MLVGNDKNYANISSKKLSVKEDGKEWSVASIFAVKETVTITKSLQFMGVGGRPLLLLPTDKFGFAVQAFKEHINVSFTNFEVAETHVHEVEKSRSCKPGSHGFISMQGVSVSIRDCVLRRMCNAINVVGPNNGLSEIKLLQSSITNVHYCVFSKNVSMITLEMQDTSIVGENDSQVPYYAVSLIIMDAAVVHIIGCTFIKLNEAVAISMHHGKLVMKLSHCQFQDNSGQSVLLSFSANSNMQASIVHLDRLEFTKNDGGYASSLHLVRSWEFSDKVRKPAPEVHLTRSVFRNNYAQAFFGAIYAEGVHLQIHSTQFNNNTAGNELSAIQAFGGAIFVESWTNVEVINSSFANNTCSGFGGAVFSRGQFSARNCEFRGSAKSSIKPLLGDILYATAGLLLENTTWYPDKSYRSKSAIWHPGSPTLESWNIKIAGHFVIYCPVGHNVTAHGLYRHPGMLTDRISMGCRSCPRDQYSLQSGHLKLVSIDDKVTFHDIRNVSCFWCRYGGVCEHGHIKSRSNYYGYISGHPEEVKFISCPFGYCCQGDDCVSYNSCSPLRRGSLCGSCAEGMTENLLSANCVKRESCKDRWFWLIYFMSGILYISFFMYLDRISAFLKGQLIWWETKLASIKEGSEVHQGPDEMLMHDAVEAEEATGSTCTNEKEEEDIRSEGGVFGECSQSLQNEEKDTSNQGDVFSNIINITFYFYQMILIIRDHDNVILSQTLVLVKEISTSIFTFSLDAESSLSLCPLAGLSPVSKSFLVRSFAIYVIVLLVIINTIEGVYTLFQKVFPSEEVGLTPNTNSTFTVRLRVTTIQITLLAYSTITNMTMNFVNCVPINGNSVLYMDGTIKCFVWWQIVAIFFIIFWIIPFPFALVLGITRLQDNAMSYHRFIIGLIFPFCFTFYCLLQRVLCCFWIDAKKDFHKCSEGDQEISEDLSDVERVRQAVESSSVQEILLRFEAPFKEENPGTISTKPGFWQGVLIIRRLIIIIMFTFINNPVTRLYFIFTACLFFLMHHLLYLPYKKDVINFFETFSSATLVMFCSINIFFAYSYVSNVPPENADARISLIFDWFEVVILVLFPLLFCVLLLILVIARISATIYKAFVNFCRKID